jgi:hypothetical protein
MWHLRHNRCFSSGCHYFLITFSANSTCSYTSKLIYGLQFVKVLLTTLSSLVNEKDCILEPKCEQLTTEKCITLDILFSPVAGFMLCPVDPLLGRDSRIVDGRAGVAR